MSEAPEPRPCSVCDLDVVGADFVSLRVGGLRAYLAGEPGDQLAIGEKPDADDDEPAARYLHRGCVLMFLDGLFAQLAVLDRQDEE